MIKPAMNGKIPCNVSIDERVWKRLKVYCVEHNRGISEYVESLIVNSVFSDKTSSGVSKNDLIRTLVNKVAP